MAGNAPGPGLDALDHEPDPVPERERLAGCRHAPRDVDEEVVGIHLTTLPDRRLTPRLRCQAPR